MKQNRLLTIVTLTIAVLIILLAGRCRKSADSAEMEVGSPEKAAEAVPEFTASTEQTETPSITAPEIKAITEQAQIAGEERTSYIEAEELTPEEALSASFHGQIERVLNDLYTSADEVKRQVDFMSDDEVIAYADEYLSVVRYVKDKVTALTDELEQMDISDMAGGEARKIQAQLSEAKEQLTMLKERYVFYIGRLEQMGVSMREYGY